MKDFIEISKYAGMREDLIQAGGGNTSEKIDEHRMLIKASGVQLADINEKEGYSVVDYSLVKRYMEGLARGELMYSEKKLLESAVIDGKRPSIEIFLHAITDKVTLHTHPAAVNVLTSRKGGMETLKEMFPDALLIEYATPGLNLAKVYYQAYLKKSEDGKKVFPLIFLKNHGLIVSGKTSDEVIRLTEAVNRKVEARVGMDNAPYRLAYEIYQDFRDHGIDGSIVKAESKVVLDAYRDFGDTMWDYQICPDCVVFCGKKPFVYKDGQEDLDLFIKQFGVPVIIQHGKDLFIRAESVRKAREIESVLAFSARVAACNRDTSMDLLTDEEQNFLLNWDAEKYRQGKA